MKIDRIILASASPRRREILEKFGIKFDIIPSDADENIPQSMPCSDYVCTLAEMKGEEVKKRLTADGEDLSRTLIISCDTVVLYRDMIIGKPADETHAMLTLGLLSDSWHSVFSGLCLIYGDRKMLDFEETRVKFADVSERDIRRYVDSGEPMGKAGSYAIQGGAASFVEQIDGDYYNIVGFPLTLFCRMLKNGFGKSIFDLGDKYDS